MRRSRGCSTIREAIAAECCAGPRSQALCEGSEYVLLVRYKYSWMEYENVKCAICYICKTTDGRGEEDGGGVHGEE